MKPARSFARSQLQGLLRVMALILVVVAYVTQPMLGWHGSRDAADVDAGRLQRDVETLSMKFAPRNASHPERLDAVADYIREQLVAAGGRVDDQDVPADGRTYRNVIARFGPDGGERLVVGAHYDTAGSTPGADDNASGVAGLLEIARLLGAAPPATCVELVAYTLEEPPHFRTPRMGSAVHASALKAQGVEVRAMIALEMIGYFTDAEGSQGSPAPLLGLLYPSQGNFVAVVGNIGTGLLVRRIKGAMQATTELPVHSLNAPGALPGVDFSDHLNYWKAGYPAVMVTDTAFYRNANYHTVRDTAETLDYGRMAQVVQGVHAAILELAEP